MILEQGSCVKVAGLDGFGFINHFIMDSDTGVVLVAVQLFNPGATSAAPVELFAPRAISPFHTDKSKASRVAPHADDHLLAALRMIEPEEVF